MVQKSIVSIGYTKTLGLSLCLADFWFKNYQQLLLETVKIILSNGVGCYYDRRFLSATKNLQVNT